MDYYIKTTKPNHYIKIYMRYNIGGWNWGTGEQMKRAMDLNISPVEKDDIFESYMAFSGYRLQAEEVKKYSSGKKKQAIEYFIKNIELVKQALDFVLQEQNLEIAEDYNLEEIIRGL